MKLRSIEKKIEDRAIDWYKDECYSREIYINEEKIDVKKITKQYLKEHPREKQKYLQIKRKINKIKLAAGLGLVTVAVGTGAICYHTSKTKNIPENEIEVINEFDNIDILNEEEIRENEYKDFFKEVGEIQNTDTRNREIVKFTKGKMVEAYNKQHKGEAINADQFKYYHLNEHVLVTKDKFGNDVSYERVPQQQESIKRGENQELKKIDGGIYVYEIDGKVVASYDSNGQEIVDSSIENKEEFFKNTINLAKEAEELQEIYKYNNSERYIVNQEQDYKETAEKLIESVTNQELTITISRENENEK